MEGKQIPEQIQPAEKIAADLAVLNLERHLRQAEPLPSEAAMADHPDHTAYVSELRDLRRRQTVFLDEHKEDLATDLTKLSIWEKDSPKRARLGMLHDNEAVLRKRNFSPLGWTALMELDDAEITNQYALSVHHVSRGIQSTEGFLEAVEHLSNRTVEVLMQRLPALERAWGRERTVRYLHDTTKKYPVFAFRGTALLYDYLGPDEAKSLMQAAAESQLKLEGEPALECGPFLLRGKYRQLFTESQVQALAQACLRYEPNYRVKMWVQEEQDFTSPVLELAKMGLVSEADAANGFVEFSSNIGTKTEAFAVNWELYKPVLEKTGQLQVVRDSVMQQCREGKVPLRNLHILQTFLSKAETREVAVYRLKHNAEGIFSSPFAAYEISALEKFVKRRLVQRQFFKCLHDLAPDNLIGMLNVLPADWLPTDQKQQVLRGVFAQHPELAFRMPNLTLNTFDEEEARYLFRSAAEHYKLQFGSLALQDTAWTELFRDEPAFLKQTMKKMLLATNGLYLLQAYDQSYALQLMFDKQEMAELVTQKLHSGDIEPDLLNLRGGLENTFLYTFSKEQIKSWMKDLAQTDPNLAVQFSASFLSAFPLSDMHTFIMDLAPQAASQIANNHTLCKRLLQPEDFKILVNELLKGPAIVAAEEIANLIDLGHLPRDLKRYYAERLLTENPAMLLLLSDGFEYSQQAAISSMKQQTEVTSLLPKWFKEFFEKVNKGSSNNKFLNQLDALEVYAAIRDVSRVDEDCLGLIAGLGKTAKEQKLLLMQLAFLAHNQPETLGTLSADASQADLQRHVDATLEDMLGGRLALAAQRRLVSGQEAFLVYFNDVKHSPPHREILTQLALADSEAAYRDARLIAATPETLTTARDNGWLPAKLTARQHEVWRQELRTSSHENLRASAAEMRQAIVNLLQENAVYLEMSPSDVLLTDDQLGELSQEVSELGGQFAVLRRELSMRRKLDPDHPDTELEQKVSEVESELATAQLRLAASKLARLSEEEIAQGASLAQSGQKARSLKGMVGQLQKQVEKQRLPQEASWTVAHLAQLIGSYTGQADELREMTVTDTVDFATTLEIGARPVVSCQHYASGAFRDYLIGYTEPNTKIITVNNGDSLVARSVLRLLEGEQGEPVLHVETIYSQSPSAVISDGIYNLALEKAQAIGGIPVYLSSKSQDEEGHQVPFKVSGDFRAIERPVAIGVRGLRSQYVYVDSAGGEQRGPYTIKNVVELQRQT